jgi:DNA-binding MarR family transcriptional regulator
LTDSASFVADPRLRALARLLLLTLCDHARHDAIAFPGYRRIRERTGMAKDTIERYAQDLEAAGRVTVERSPRKVNRYRILPWRPLDLGGAESGSYVPASRTAA